MVKRKELSSFQEIQRKGLNSPITDPFTIVYNHRKTLRAKQLKKMKIDRINFQKNLLSMEREAEKHQNQKSWNQSMLEEDSVWENACDMLKKETRSQDSTVSNSTQQNERLYKRISTKFPLTQKVYLFGDAFTGFQLQFFAN